jgi:hypothetical protein
LRSEEKMHAALDKATAKLTTGVSGVTEYIFSKPEADIGSYFVKKTQALVKSKAFSNVGTEVHFVDVVKDVINLLPIHWISQEIVKLFSVNLGQVLIDFLQAGLPLKTENNPTGVWDEQTMYDMFAEIGE